MYLPLPIAKLVKENIWLPGVKIGKCGLGDHRIVVLIPVAIVCIVAQRIVVPSPNASSANSKVFVAVWHQERVKAREMCEDLNRSSDGTKPSQPGTCGWDDAQDNKRAQCAR
jgi:hypothetical protein